MVMMTFLIIGPLLMLSRVGNLPKEAYFTHMAISGTFSLSLFALSVEFTQPAYSARRFIMYIIKAV